MEVAGLYFTFPDPLYHVVEMSHSKEEWTDDDGPELRVVTCKHIILNISLSSHHPVDLISPSRTGTMQARNVNSSLKGATT